MMLNIRTTFLFMLMISAAPAFAQTLSLEQILKEIEQNNPSLKGYESRIKSKEARVEGAGAWMPPMIGAGTFMTPYPGQGTIGEDDK
ncbi:MAG TPA: hypothetical protein VGD31_14760, partial [Sphingobacteriaceae bacterium]